MRRISAVLLLAAAAAGCGEESAPEPAGPQFQQLEADQVMVEVEHYMTREGVRRAHLQADTVYFLDEGATAHLRHFTVDFFGEAGATTSVLSARDGRYRLQSGDMEATEDVRVVDEDESQRLFTERLIYDSETGRLRSDVEFVMVQGRDTIRGIGFVTDPGLDSLTIQRPGAVLPPTDTAGAGGRPDAGVPDTVQPESRPDTADDDARAGGAAGTTESAQVHRSG